MHKIIIMLRNTSKFQMTDNEIKHFRSRMHDVITGNISQEESACMRERRKQIDSTYDEFIKENGGKNPIIGTYISILSPR